ncbi:50S ribosomal protein L25 [Candidatus Pantoea carbekii]|uniref:Large ribosomal subunit protein bL25 n=1 Tax=Candidatus Pantoea carbekii TaxID=1235990 RepID=U3U7V7_9GAMM|nr:50S ribosomal protein L25 [Candidatus Pantoea carbekii]AKC32010.1 50S ribosomal protein L25 [Candidatus Pantoea carbekii]BAO00532.1 50S ribosomal protein L25 [Candidatus Pantoea carbekii]
MFIINAKIRTENGKSASRRLRLKNKFPAIIYGIKETTALSIELEHDVIMNMQNQNNFYSEALSILLNGKEIKVKIQAVQRHPFKKRFYHIDFIRI